MRIQSINNYHNQPSCKAGLYFTKAHPIFNRQAEFITDEIVKTSKDGFKYIEDTQISEELKDRFAKTTLISDLAEKFDTFICFSEIPIGHKSNPSDFEHFAFARIWWGDERESWCKQCYNKIRKSFNIKPVPNYAQIREVFSHSEKSIQSATEKMFKNLEKGIFC